MAIQLSLIDYTTRFQAALTTLLSLPTPVKVYNLYNPNSGNDSNSEFVVWTIRNMHQDVYTGMQTNKGIDKPVFDITVFAKSNVRLIAITDLIITGWHGYTGNLNGISVGKFDVDMLLTTYDDESSYFMAVIDIAAQIAVPATVTTGVQIKGQPNFIRR